MPRPLSQLVYTRIQEGTGSPRVITLHRHNQRGGDVADYGRAASPHGRVIGLESSKGVFVGREIVGYTWFVGPPHQPSPLFFGDALAEIERFLWDEVDRQGGPEAELPVLLGVEQGAIMALAAAAAVPDLLSGVIAVDGFLPIVPGWQPPLVPLDGLPILLIDGRDTVDHPDRVLSGDQLAATLARWGASVTRRDAVADGGRPDCDMATWLSEQPLRRRSRASV